LVLRLLITLSTVQLSSLLTTPISSTADNNERRLVDGSQVFRNKATDKADAAGAAKVVDIEANKAGLPNGTKELPTRERAASKTQSSAHTRKSSKSVK
jgi:hypothetical protein